MIPATIQDMKLFKSTQPSTNSDNCCMFSALSKGARKNVGNNSTALFQLFFCKFSVCFQTLWKIACSSFLVFVYLILMAAGWSIIIHMRVHLHGGVHVHICTYIPVQSLSVVLFLAVLYQFQIWIYGWALFWRWIRFWHQTWPFPIQKYPKQQKRPTNIFGICCLYVLIYGHIHVHIQLHG